MPQNYESSIHEPFDTFSVARAGEDQWVVGRWLLSENPLMSRYTTLVYRYSVDLKEAASHTRLKGGGVRLEEGQSAEWFKCEQHGPFQPDTRHWCVHVDAVRKVTT